MKLTFKERIKRKLGLPTPSADAAEWGEQALQNLAEMSVSLSRVDEILRKIQEQL